MRVLQSEIVRTFGDSFAKQLSVLEQGRWQGPISSSFGQHFVFVNERAQGGLPPHDAVREAVHREWANAHRLEETQKLYRTLRERYEIVVEPPPGSTRVGQNQSMKPLLLSFSCRFQHISRASSAVG